APNVWPTASSNAGRNLFPPANTLQRIAAWMRCGSSVSFGMSRSSSESISVRVTTRNSLAPDLFTTDGTEEDIKKSLRRLTSDRFRTVSRLADLDCHASEFRSGVRLELDGPGIRARALRLVQTIRGSFPAVCRPARVRARCALALPAMIQTVSV